MWQFIFVTNFFLCLIFKFLSDRYLIRKTKGVPFANRVITIGYWQYSRAEVFLPPEDVVVFRKLYRSAQLLLLLLLVQAALAIVVLFIKSQHGQ